MSLNHRVAAMKSLNEALSRPCLTMADRDSRYGAILALTFQASAMPDALMEFIVTMRGCMVIGSSLENVTDSLFGQYGAESWAECFKQMMPADLNPRIDGTVLDDVSASLRVVAPLCQSVGELTYLSQLERIVQLARTDVSEGMETPLYSKFFSSSFYLLTLPACLTSAMSFSLTNKMTDEEFASFASPDNYTAQILLAHFLVLDHIIETWTFGSKCLPYPFKREISLLWVENIAAKLPSSCRKYMVWPVGNIAALRELAI